jgi:hypothetical protein
MNLLHKGFGCSGQNGYVQLETFRQAEALRTFRCDKTVKMEYNLNIEGGTRYA